MGTVPTRHWSREWRLFATAIALLLAADLATTAVAVGRVGLGAEANPIMRWLFSRGIGITVTVHLAILLVVVTGFAAVVRIGQSLDESRRRHYRRWCGRWLRALIVLGLLVVTINVTVIVRG